VLSKDAPTLIGLVMATFKPDGEGRMPLLCEADEQTHMAWCGGERAAKKALVDAFCARFHIEFKAFDEKAFRESCLWSRL
jgi:hypothetical protein